MNVKFQVFYIKKLLYQRIKVGNILCCNCDQYLLLKVMRIGMGSETCHGH